MDLKTKVPMWKSEAAIDRVLACALFLKVHGFVSDAERQKIHKRMLAWVKKHGFDATPMEHGDGREGRDGR